jgi:hypothetical protein
MKLSTVWSTIKAKACTHPSPPPSLFFYTVHKCASSLFTREVLPQVGGGLHHIDYAAQLYGKEAEPPFHFAERGGLYGPIRVTAPDFRYPEYTHVIAPLTEPGFLCGRRAVILVRDPRDVLVSMFFSFGFSHNRSPDPAVAALQEKRRAAIQAQGLDDFCLSEAAQQRVIFATLHRLAGEAAEVVIVRYEDLLRDFSRAVLPLSTAMHLDAAVVETMRRELRPRTTEDPSSHHRSGQPGAYASKLKPDTIAPLEKELGMDWLHFGYRPHGSD